MAEAHENLKQIYTDHFAAVRGRDVVADVALPADNVVKQRLVEILSVNNDEGLNALNTDTFRNLYAATHINFTRMHAMLKIASFIYEKLNLIANVGNAALAAIIAPPEDNEHFHGNAHLRENRITPAPYSLRAKMIAFMNIINVIVDNRGEEPFTREALNAFIANINRKVYKVITVPAHDTDDGRNIPEQRFTVTYPVVLHTLYHDMEAKLRDHNDELHAVQAMFDDVYMFLKIVEFLSKDEDDSNRFDLERSFVYRCEQHKDPECPFTKYNDQVMCMSIVHDALVLKRICNPLPNNDDIQNIVQRGRGADNLTNETITHFGYGDAVVPANDPNFTNKFDILRNNEYRQKIIQCYGACPFVDLIAWMMIDKKDMNLVYAVTMVYAHLFNINQACYIPHEGALAELRVGEEGATQAQVDERHAAIEAAKNAFCMRKITLDDLKDNNHLQLKNTDFVDANGNIIVVVFNIRVIKREARYLDNGACCDYAAQMIELQRYAYVYYDFYKNVRGNITNVIPIGNIINDYDNTLLTGGRVPVHNVPLPIVSVIRGGREHNFMQGSSKAKGSLAAGFGWLALAEFIACLAALVFICVIAYIVYQEYLAYQRNKLKLVQDTEDTIAARGMGHMNARIPKMLE